MSKALPGLVRYGAFLDEEFHIRYGAKRLVLITSREVASITGYEDILQRAETKIERIYVPDGERQKDISVVNQVMDELSALKFPRDGLIVALGGGATTDLAGFAASIWMWR
jgi:shikimate kinase / 3-dehydroquinate synthase